MLLHKTYYTDDRDEGAMMKTQALALMILGIMCHACGDADEHDAPPIRTMTTCGVQSEQACEEEAMTWPDWKLEDVQPQSARFGETYGLDAFAGKTVFVSFLVGWCGYCRAQAVELEAIRVDPEFADVVFVVVHGANANNDEDRLKLLTLDDQTTPRHNMLMFQDTEQVNAWGQHGGAKDDFYIYAPDGTLSSYLEGGTQTNLATPEGRAFVRQALLDAKK